MTTLKQLNSTTFKSRGLRGLGLALALIIALGAVAFYFTGATANPPSAAEISIQGWVTELKQDKLTASRQQAQRQLEMAGEAAVPSLLTALNSNDAILRRNAADMLGYIASPTAAPALRKAMLNDNMPEVRRNAAWALGEIKDVASLHDLEQVSVLDRNKLVRATAADSIARIRTTLAYAAGLNEQSVGTMAIAPAQPGLVYFTSQRDLVVSHDSGRTWNTAANVLPSQVNTLAVNPTNTQMLFAGVDGMGVYSSVDGGQTWSPVNQGLDLPSGARFGVTAITVDPANPNDVYIATGVWLGTGTVQFYPLSVMSSRDGGNSWQLLSQITSEQPISRLVVSGDNLYGLAGERVLSFGLTD